MPEHGLTVSESLVYFACYGIFLHPSPPYEHLQREFGNQVPTREQPYTGPTLNHLKDKAVRLVECVGDAEVLSCCGDAFYLRGDLDKAKWFYEQAIRKRRRMISMREAAWSSYRILQIDQRN